MKTVAEHAWLLEYADADERAANARAREAWRRLLEARPPGLVDAVPAARSLLVAGTSAFDAHRLRALEEVPVPEAEPTGRKHEVPVRADGEDLAGVLSRLGLGREEFLATLSGLTFTVGFLGFSPGFPYLYGLPPEWHLPRRATPRPAVPAGSVALAGAYAGIYPGATPGGWNLIGKTPLRLFDPSRTEAALLSPGDLVRFVPQ